MHAQASGVKTALYAPSANWNSREIQSAIMTIDDVIEKLNEFRSQYGNIPICMVDQSCHRVFYAGTKMEHRIVYGQDFYKSFADTPIAGDKAIGVVVFFRESR